MRSAIYATESLALAACAKLDAAHGYPRMEQGEIGPPVWTERYTVPIPLEDGTFAVQMTDTLRTTTRIAEPLATRDLSALRKRTAEEIAETDVKPGKVKR